MSAGIILADPARFILDTNDIKQKFNSHREECQQTNSDFTVRICLTDYRIRFEKKWHKDALRLKAGKTVVLFFFQAVFKPYTVLKFTDSIRFSKIIWISLNKLNASDEMF